MTRTLVIADIHGGYKALCQCLERSNFVWGKDHLICLGDICDGWPEVKECVDILMSIPHLVLIAGNHDAWALEWMTTGQMQELWVEQGGQATLRSYNYKVIQEHVMFLKTAVRYYLDEENRLFVHGGIDLTIPLCENTADTCMWDRNLIRYAFATRNDKTPLAPQYKEIFVGHTTTSRMDPTLKPIIARGIIDLDTGAGWEGKLTIMDAETKEYWQSDIVKDLYPHERGRR